MTAKQTDIEKTLKRILARQLAKWPDGATHAVITKEASNYEKNVLAFTEGGAPIWNSALKYFSILTEGCEDNVFWLIRATIDNDFGLDSSPENIVTRAQWEAERALLASEQTQPLGDSEEFDQALWDKVAIAAIGGLTASDIFYNSSMFQYRPDNAAEFASGIADAFMAERAKRIAARKAGA